MSDQNAVERLLGVQQVHLEVFQLPQHVNCCIISNTTRGEPGSVSGAIEPSVTQLTALGCPKFGSRKTI